MRPFEQLHSALVAAQNERDLRPVTNGDDGWIAWERGVMLGEVNRLRSGKPVTEEDIRRAEDMATGHFDYTKKFALYCEDLVLND